MLGLARLSWPSFMNKQWAFPELWEKFITYNECISLLSDKKKKKSSAESKHFVYATFT